jgi:signal transduction histidine kinase
VYTPRNSVAAIATGALLVVVFATMVIWFRSGLRDEIHLKILERDADVLYPMALQQISDSEAAEPSNPAAPIGALLRSARQKGMLAVAVFDRNGNTIEAVPQTQIFVELPAEDYIRLQAGGPITRYHEDFPLDQYFAGVSRSERPAPVLEVLLALPGAASGTAPGFVRYYIDARPIARELFLIDARINRQTVVILAVGAVLIAAVLAAAAFSIHRAQRVAAERKEGLIRANFELTLAAKVSAIGQISAHLIHGLQGSVSGLRSVVASRDAGEPSAAWDAAAAYTERLQTMIQETVALLGDTGAHASYELTGHELAASIRDRNEAPAAKKGVILVVTGGFAKPVDSHRGNLLCLIAVNLVQNAIFATDPRRTVAVHLEDARDSIVLTVADEGSGIPESMQKDLFKPGRSSRPDGSGLGLAISQLLARQIGAEIAMVSTGPGGTTFSVTVSRGS